LYYTSPRLAVIRLAPRTSHSELVPLGSLVLDAFGALGIAAAAASLQGFYPSVGWGAPSLDFSTCGGPGSPGFSSSLGRSPARPLASRLPHPASRPRTATPNCSVCRKWQRRTRSASSSIPGKHPCGHRTLCFKFQRTGKLACLLRGCRPLKVFRPHPQKAGFRTGRRGPASQQVGVRTGDLQLPLPGIPVSSGIMGLP
jgi:hypothetical protein